MARLWLRCDSETSHREPPELPGLDHREGTWQLRMDYYRTFIADVTGIEPPPGPSTSELKTIQSRLEGCIETYEREGQCSCDEFSRYEYVDSIATVHELARFFRVLATDPIENNAIA